MLFHNIFLEFCSNSFFFHLKQFHDFFYSHSVLFFATKVISRIFFLSFFKFFLLLFKVLLFLQLESDSTNFFLFLFQFVSFCCKMILQIFLLSLFKSLFTLLQPRSENYFRIEKKIGKKWQIFRENEALKIIE